jgi:lactoylglutathione lyase
VARQSSVKSSTAMKLAHTMIRVKDLEKTLAFYTGFIGLKEARRKSIGDEATLVWLEDGNGHYSIELTFNHGQSEYTLGDQFGHLAFVTSDLDAVIRDVEGRGWWYRQSRPEMSSRYIFVKDPNGYDIEIIER